MALQAQLNQPEAREEVHGRMNQQCINIKNTICMLHITPQITDL